MFGSSRGREMRGRDNKFIIFIRWFGGNNKLYDRRIVLEEVENEDVCF